MLSVWSKIKQNWDFSCLRKICTSFTARGEKYTLRDFRARMREGPRSTSSFYGWVMTRDPITERTVVTPPEGADYLETGMQIWALEKKGTTQRAQILSACTFLVEFCSEGSIHYYHYYLMEHFIFWVKRKIATKRSQEAGHEPGHAWSWILQTCHIVTGMEGHL